MEGIDQLHADVEAIAAACGDLAARYVETEAIGLMLAIGRYRPMLRQMLLGPRADREQARAAMDAACAELEAAIRRAVANPAGIESQQAVVGDVQRLQARIRQARMSFRQTA